MYVNIVGYDTFGHPMYGAPVSYTVGCVPAGYVAYDPLTMSQYLAPAGYTPSYPVGGYPTSGYPVGTVPPPYGFY